MTQKIVHDRFCVNCGNFPRSNGIDFNDAGLLSRALASGLVERDVRKRCDGGIPACSEENVKGKSSFCFKCGIPNETKRASGNALHAKKRDE